MSKLAVLLVSKLQHEFMASLSILLNLKPSLHPISDFVFLAIQTPQKTKKREDSPS